MPSASTIRLQIEAALAHRIPSALTPPPRAVRPTAPTGVPAVDALLEGGLPLGAITEMVGPECSGRTCLAFSFVAGVTQTGNVAAWIDVSDSLDPESATATGIDLSRVLWVRCAVSTKTATPSHGTFQLQEKYPIAPSAKKEWRGSGFGSHPRTEVKGLSKAVGELLRPEVIAPRNTEPPPAMKREKEIIAPVLPQSIAREYPSVRPGKPWARIAQALRVTDLLLQAGGFRSIVLDMASIAPEHASRVPLATWFRYRMAAERSQTSLVLLTQHPCAKSSRELLLRFQPGKPNEDETTIFTGMECHIEVERRAGIQTLTKVVPMRRSPQRETGAGWRSQSMWAGAR